MEFAWELSLEGFGFDPEKIWITVFEGDDELGLGPDEEAIEAWLDIGVPRERIVQLPRSENFWQAGPTGPCGPCSELYLDRGLEFGSRTTCRAARTSASSSTGTSSSCSSTRTRSARSTPLPAQNIDTGLGLERMAAIQQGTHVGVRDRPVPPADRPGGGAQRRALRRRRRRRPRAADPRRPHARHVLPLADGVVPPTRTAATSCGASCAGRSCRAGASASRPGFLPAFAGRVRELMGDAYPRAPRAARRRSTCGWPPRRRRSAARSSRARGILDEHIARARECGRRGHRRRRGLPAPRHLRLPRST